MNRSLAEWIGTIFYIGKLPKAPGTWASLIATISWYFIFRDLNFFILPVITFILFFLGIIASNKIIENSSNHDPSKIVIDEWVGQWIAFTMLPVNIYTGVIGFLSFRLFDISKFGPVKKMESLPKGLGVMADDVMAGILSYFVVILSYWIFL